MAYHSTKQVTVRAPTGPRVVVPIVAGIGNAIMAVPLIRQIKRAKPDARITILALTSPMAEPFRRLKEVDEHLVCGTGFGGYLNLLRESRKRKPEFFVVPFPSNRWQYNVLQRLSGARQRVMHGYDFGKLRALAFLKAKRVPAEEHIHDTLQNLRLLDAMGFKSDPKDAKPTFKLELDEMKAGERLRKEAKLKQGQPYLVMHAGSANTVLAEAKRWPAERYANLCQAIQRTMKIPVVLVEGPDERGIAEQIVNHLEPGKADIRVVPLNGPLGEAAALMANALAYVGTDSGLAHLAAAVGIPAITLFAPADPDRVCPAGQRDLVVQPPDGRAAPFLYPYQATRPKIPPEELGRINTITVEQVMEKVAVASGPLSRVAMGEGTSA